MRWQSVAVERVDVGAVHVPPNRRPVDERIMPALVTSLEMLGLQTPITVRHVEVMDIPGEGELHGVPVLVAGRHRLEAARRLGWELIPCVFMAGDEQDARLWEIAENLHRADLSSEERRQQIAEWVRLTVDKVLAEPTPLGGQQPRERAISKAAREFGFDKSTVSRAVAAESLTDVAKAEADRLGLNTRDRAKASAAPEEQQVQRVAEVAASRVKPVPTPLNDIETEDQWRGAMMRLWNRAPDEWREHFIDYVQAPVFDNTRVGRGDSLAATR